MVLSPVGSKGWEDTVQGELQSEWWGGEHSSAKIMHRYKMAGEKRIARKALKNTIKTTRNMKIVRIRGQSRDLLI